MKNVREILQEYLRANGADGLCSDFPVPVNDECGCPIDDLAPCGGDCLDCVPAIKTTVGDARKRGCELEGNDDTFVFAPVFMDSVSRNT